MEKITKNLPRKIMSLVLAIILWLIIYNIYDPTIELKIDNIKVSILNENIITDLGKVYTIDKNDTISVYVKGKQSILKNLDETDVVATADLKDLSVSNSVTIQVSIPKLRNEDIEIDYSKNNTMHISLDNYVSKTFNLEIIKENDIDSNYYLDTDNCNEVIKISGPQEIVKSINKVAISVDATTLIPGYSNTYKIQLLDSFDKQINDSSLELSTKEYTYKPIIYNTKTIPLKISCVGEPAFGYSLTESSNSPSLIKIAGPDDDLKKYDELNIDYDISNLNQSKNVNIDLTKYLSSNIKIISDQTTAELQIKMNKLITKDYVFTTKDLTIKNLLENYTYKYETTGDILITVMGEEALLNNLTIDKISPYIDLENKSEGTYTLEVKIPEGLNISLTSQTTITINIISNNSNYQPTEEITNNINNEDNSNNNYIERESTTTSSSISESSSQKSSSESLDEKEETTMETTEEIETSTTEKKTKDTKENSNKE